MRKQTILLPLLFALSGLMTPERGLVNIGMADEAAPSTAEAQAREILDLTGVQGGVIVHLGCGDGAVTAALRANDRYLVQGLDRDREQVRLARKNLLASKAYGEVSVDQWDGLRLPYADNLVNLIVAEDPAEVAEVELLRVLCPLGVACLRQGDGWTTLIKPRPDEIDDWTHYMHGPDNNAVAKDSVVGPPQHVQWMGGPKWARGHEVLATLSVMVSSGGRVFYISDDGPTASVDLPSEWSLTARDAFNGKLLWKRPIPRWESEHRPFRSGPPHLPRRLVAIDDTVYVTLGFGEDVVALNAATGEQLREYADTAGTEEILVEGQRVYLVIGDLADQEAVDRAVRRGEKLPPVQKRIVSIDSRSGELLWEKSGDDTADLYAQTLAIGGGQAVFQNTRFLICLDADTGTEKWRAQRPSSTARPAWSVPTVVVQGDVVISADRQAPDEVSDVTQPQDVDWDVSFAGGNAPPGDMIAFSMKTGERVWQAPCKEGYNAPVDVLLTDGLLWSGDLVKAADPGITAGRDPVTGEVRRERPEDANYFTPGMSHHRCYRNRATEKYVLLGRSGVEMLDVATGKAVANHWIRGTCQFGVLPANGLLYVPPHTCACYVKTKLNGLNALASTQQPVPADANSPRLQRGPAYAEATALAEAGTDRLDWPTYRHDARRSGATTSQVPSNLHRSWTSELGGRLSAPTIASGRVFVAQPDTHGLQALDADDGQSLWRFTAGGPIDSPPTLIGDLVLFGSHDGYVYCLRARDGELVWRFRGGPAERIIVADERFESAWPIHGSVMEHRGVVYLAAGRSSFLDGGILLIGLDPRSGDIIAESVLSGRDPATGEQPRDVIDRFEMPGGLPDVLSTDGEHVYMRELKFDQQCRQCDDFGLHLFSPTGFLDETWWHRSYWIWGPEFKSGWPGWHQAGNTYPAGRLLVFNDDTIYGFGRSFMPQGNAGQWTTGESYRLFAASKTLQTPEPAPKQVRRGQRPYPKSLVDFAWSTDVKPEVRAMVLAGDLLFVAGPEGETHTSLSAFRGEEGILLQAVSTSDGQPQSTMRLESLPVLDGLAVAQGRLYLASRNGTITCFAEN